MSELRRALKDLVVAAYGAVVTGAVRYIRPVAYEDVRRLTTVVGITSGGFETGDMIKSSGTYDRGCRSPLPFESRLVVSEDALKAMLIAAFDEGYRCGVADITGQKAVIP